MAITNTYSAACCSTAQTGCMSRSGTQISSSPSLQHIHAEHDWDPVKELCRLRHSMPGILQLVTSDHFSSLADIKRKAWKACRIPLRWLWLLDTAHQGGPGVAAEAQRQ